ncbi:hypothetical protein MITS9504_01265 [Synechococcus sp. MIT S9504]|nr:hypothetical protein MITS9504_01265 [Synechococcus sp. MIT S9504]
MWLGKFGETTTACPLSLGVSEVNTPREVLVNSCSTALNVLWDVLWEECLSSELLAYSHLAGAR